MVLDARVMCLQLSTSPARSALINTLEGLRRTSPSLVRQFLPVLDQLEPIFASLADGTQQFVPHPAETSEQLRTQYGAHWCSVQFVGQGCSVIRVSFLIRQYLWARESHLP
jgi:hypothetical protein